MGGLYNTKEFSGFDELLVYLGEQVECAEGLGLWIVGINIDMSSIEPKVYRLRYYFSK